MVRFLLGVVDVAGPSVWRRRSRRRGLRGSVAARVRLAVLLGLVRFVDFGGMIAVRVASD